MSFRISRRRFLGTTAALSAAAALPRIIRADEPKSSPNGRLSVAVVGVSGQGQYNWGELARVANCEVVALCDVHDSRTGEARKKFPKATFDTDFRKMLDRKGIDAVLCATPDHTHASVTVAALKSGRHVYCEKPLTHTVAEARLVAETAKANKRVTQMGTQIHATGNYRRIVELIRSGAIGTVNEVHTWCGKSWGGGERPEKGQPVPKDLDWELWVGPAPMRPYHSTYVPFNWRRWWDFGGGTLADMACHHMDLPFWALNLTQPTHVKADGPKPHVETAALALTVEYQFPGIDGRGPVKLTWYDGGRRPSLFKEKKLPQWGDGNLFVGSKGMLLADYGSYKLLPEDQFAGFTPPKPTIPNSIGHHREWVEACIKGAVGTTTCNFDYSGALTEAVLLGVAAYRCGEPIEWDAKELKAKNTSALEKYIHKDYRKGWELG